MRAKYVGNKADRFIHVVKNGEASASIPRGTPVILKLSTTVDNANDGLSVVLPATAGDPNCHFGRYGVVTDTLATGQYGESILFGNVGFAIVTLMTRSASSASWTSSQSQASGIALGIDTINNCFLPGVSSAGSLPGAGAGAWLLDSLPSSAASATATTDTRTCITNSARVFVRYL